MLRSYVTGVLVIVAMFVAWAFVQIAWRRAFPDAAADPDALAGRGGCGGCERESESECGRSESTEEEKR